MYNNGTNPVTTVVSFYLYTWFMWTGADYTLIFRSTPLNDITKELLTCTSDYSCQRIVCDQSSHQAGIQLLHTMKNIQPLGIRSRSHVSVCINFFFTC